MAQKRDIHIESELLAKAIKREEFLICDGAMGTQVQAAGLSAVHQNPDLLNISHPHQISEIQHAYVSAGSQCVVTNTFNSNRLKLKEYGVSVEEMYERAAKIARNAGALLVAGDIGPTGMLLEPMGPLAVDDAFAIFSEQARAAESAGCDLIFIETMTDLLEAKIAVLAAAEQTRLPIFATMSFGEDGRTFLGTTPPIAATTLASLGASAVGANCSLGPVEMEPFIEIAAQAAPGALIAQPNAGLPKLVDGESVFDVGPTEFANAMKRVVEAGASVIGGCCGTTPDHIRELADLVKDSKPVPSVYAPAFRVTSAQEMASLSNGQDGILVIGERLNPTGRKRMKAAIESHDIDYLAAEAILQERAGADILDVNVGVPGIDEAQILAEVVQTLQSCTTSPLQLDSSDENAIERASRIYAGRPMINSVNGSEESLSTILPIAAKYGCCIVGLTLDEHGIPATAQERIAIARRIIDRAIEAGLSKEDIAIDCLVMSAATNQSEVKEILQAVSLCKSELGVRAILGVSNVSFGLPRRSLLNSTFMSAAFGAGLDMPIMNPLDERSMDTVDAYRALIGQDEKCAEYISCHAQRDDPYDASVGDGGAVAINANRSDGLSHGGPSNGGSSHGSHSQNEVCDTFLIDESAFSDETAALELADAVITGRAITAASATSKLLENDDALDLIDSILIPALDEVGKRYDAGTFFLPQLMASAEAAKASFDEIRAEDSINAGAEKKDSSNAIVLATVEGDIHDIGKNIVGMLLGNYGYEIIDLGRNVAPEAVVEAVKEHSATLVGLSALMTTTVGAMARTIDLLHKECEGVEIMVGGAVITEDFAAEIGADRYAKDASVSAHIAKEHFSS